MLPISSLLMGKLGGGADPAWSEGTRALGDPSSLPLFNFIPTQTHEKITAGSKGPSQLQGCVSCQLRLRSCKREMHRKRKKRVNRCRRCLQERQKPNCHGEKVMLSLTEAELPGRTTCDMVGIPVLQANRRPEEGTIQSSAGHTAQPTGACSGACSGEHAVQGRRCCGSLGLWQATSG